MNKKSLDLAIQGILSKIPKGINLVSSRVKYYLIPRIVRDVINYCVPPLFKRSVRSQATSEIKGLFRFLTAILPRKASQFARLMKILAPASLYRRIEKYLRFQVRGRDDYPVVYWMPEHDVDQIQKKVNLYCEIARVTRLDRVRIFRELGRLERLLGNKMTACVYSIRAMRLAGEDTFHDLPWVCRTLQEAGFSREAAAIDAMYGEHSLRNVRCAELLEEANKRCMNAPDPCEFEIFDDRRGNGFVKVAVITSLYNAAAKLGTFLQALQCQTLNRAGYLEVILIDSGSPTNEYDVLKNVELAYPIRWLYVRTSNRETIQTAWNRAIGLARADHLTFLGVDETVIPTALEELSAHLDADVELDWIQADSLITEVDANGLLANDVMKYDRDGYTPNHVYLETCYLSWVGAMYRRSIHDRFGYYDGTFSAAGDTEFKNRVLSHLKTKHLPKTLGVFLNYPEERTTASPRAEIEDIRAWYLHRTSAGIERAFANKNSAELERILILSLQYRKSYCGHQSSDVEYAQNTIEVLKKRDPRSAMLSLEDSIKNLLYYYRALDYLPDCDKRRAEKIVKRINGIIDAIQRQHRTSGRLPSADYSIMNDNRHEQHHFIWQSGVSPTTEEFEAASSEAAKSKDREKRQAA